MKPGWWNWDLPPEALDRFDPWFVSANLGLVPLLQAGYNPASGAEGVLIGKAGERPVIGLETVEFQLDMFDSMPMEVQLVILDRTIENTPNIKEYVDSMVGSWMAGDTETIAAVLNKALDTPEAFDWMIGRRNAKWAEWIEDRVDRPGTVFIAVGAGHLAGHGSVQEYLSKRGIETTRIR